MNKLEKIKQLNSEITRLRKTGQALKKEKLDVIESFNYCFSKGDSFSNNLFKKELKKYTVYSNDNFLYVDESFKPVYEFSLKNHVIIYPVPLKTPREFTSIMKFLFIHWKKLAPDDLDKVIELIHNQNIELATIILKGLLNIKS